MIFPKNSNDNFSVVALVLTTIWLFSSCDHQPVFERNKSISGQTWDYGDTISFSVEITDTIALHNIFVNFRHTDSYPFSNLWLKVIERNPDGDIKSEMKNFKLAYQDGVWTGNCTGEICFNRVFYKSQSYSKPGVYQYLLLQDSRKEALPHLLDIGLRIENVLDPLN